MKQVLVLLLINITGSAAFAQRPEGELYKKGIILPVVTTALGNYTNLVKIGSLLYLSGRGPLQTDGSYVIGKLGRELTTNQGYSAARLCAIAQIAVLKSELGDLSKIRRIVKVTGFVNGTDLFTDQPKVINGYSDLMVEIFGLKGIHARSAVGVSNLPFGWPVEVEMIVEIEEEK